VTFAVIDASAGRTYSWESMPMTDGSTNPEGMVQLRARGSVDEAWQRLEAAVAARHLTVFARIDFAADAAAAGLTLRPTRLLLFGNPRAGSPVIAAAPTVAVDLPLRVLIWKAGDGAVIVGYNTPAFLAARHGVPDDLVANLQPVEMLAAIASGTV
jgi:uncharacterized protein (DUF302 family)